jgi:hypothetical protein
MSELVESLKIIAFENCFETHQIDPDSIAPLSQDAAAPEFGPLADMVVAVSIIGVVIISMRFRFNLSQNNLMKYE